MEELDVYADDIIREINNLIDENTPEAYSITIGEYLSYDSGITRSTFSRYIRNMERESLLRIVRFMGRLHITVIGAPEDKEAQLSALKEMIEEGKPPAGARTTKQIALARGQEHDDVYDRLCRLRSLGSVESAMYRGDLHWWMPDSEEKND